MHPKTLLFALIGAVPLAVIAAGVAAFLLQRAGYGLVVWALVPLGGLLLVASLLGAVFGWAASGRRNRGDDDV
jgi:hypothetical protein